MSESQVATESVTTVTPTPDLLTALKGLAKYTDFIARTKSGFWLDVYHDGDCAFSVYSEGNSELDLAQLEHLLVKLAVGWGLCVERVVKKDLSELNLYYRGDIISPSLMAVPGFFSIIGKDDITSNAHALAVGLLKFKEGNS